jgi:hypothetical protein
MVWIEPLFEAVFLTGQVQYQFEPALCTQCRLQITVIKCRATLFADATRDMAPTASG